jgi:hypothetical protein
MSYPAPVRYHRQRPLQKDISWLSGGLFPAPPFLQDKVTLGNVMGRPAVFPGKAEFPAVDKTKQGGDLVLLSGRISQPEPEPANRHVRLAQLDANTRHGFELHLNLFDAVVESHPGILTSSGARATQL